MRSLAQHSSCSLTIGHLFPKICQQVEVEDMWAFPKRRKLETFDSSFQPQTRPNGHCHHSSSKFKSVGYSGWNETDERIFIIKPIQFKIHLLSSLVNNHFEILERSRLAVLLILINKSVSFTVHTHGVHPNRLPFIWFTEKPIFTKKSEVWNFVYLRNPSSKSTPKLPKCSTTQCRNCWIQPKWRPWWTFAVVPEHRGWR